MADAERKRKQTGRNGCRRLPVLPPEPRTKLSPQTEKPCCDGLNYLLNMQSDEFQSPNGETCCERLKNERVKLNEMFQSPNGETCFGKP